MSRRLLTLLGVLVVVSMLVTACGATATPTTAPTAASQPTTAASTTLTFCIGGDAVRLDPHDADDGLSMLILDHIFDGLTKVTDTTGTPQPWLAERWEFTPDLKEWTFYLRKGVTFSDGTPLNADTYIWNIERQWDPNHPFHKTEYATLEYYLLKDYIGFGLKGDPEAGLQSLEKIDDYTIKLVLKETNPLLLKWTHVLTFLAVSPASFEKYGRDTYQNPVGTGAYMLEEWVKDDRITLVKNPDSWAADKFPLDKIVFRVITDSAARYLAVKAGDCQGMNLVSPDDAANAAKDPNLQVALRPPANVGYIRFNMNVKPLDDVNVRLALAHAVDKQSIVDNLYSGLGIVATQFLGPLYPGYNEDVKGYPFDLEKAKEYLKAAGLENGFTIDYWYMPVARPYFPNAKAVAEKVAADWAKIGVIANLKTEDWGQYLNDRSAGKFPIFMMGWTPDFIDGQVLDVWFKDVPLGSGPASKEAGFANQEVNDLLIAAMKTGDEAERARLYEQVAVIVNEIVPGVPVVHTSVPVILSKKVQGFIAVPLKEDTMFGVTIAP